MYVYLHQSFKRVQLCICGRIISKYILYASELAWRYQRYNVYQSASIELRSAFVSVISVMRWVRVAQLTRLGTFEHTLLIAITLVTIHLPTDLLVMLTFDMLYTIIICKLQSQGHCICACNCWGVLCHWWSTLWYAMYYSYYNHGHHWCYCVPLLDTNKRTCTNHRRDTVTHLHTNMCTTSLIVCYQIECMNHYHLQFIVIWYHVVIIIFIRHMVTCKPISECCAACLHSFVNVL